MVQSKLPLQHTVNISPGPDNKVVKELITIYHQRVVIETQGKGKR